MQCITYGNAERMLYLRAQIESNQWENMLDEVKAYRRNTRDFPETWNPTPYSVDAPENAQVHLNLLLKGFKK